MAKLLSSYILHASASTIRDLKMSSLFTRSDYEDVRLFTVDLLLQTRPHLTEVQREAIATDLINKAMVLLFGKPGKIPTKRCRCARFSSTNISKNLRRKRSLVTFGGLRIESCARTQLYPKIEELKVVTGKNTTGVEEDLSVNEKAMPELEVIFGRLCSLQTENRGEIIQNGSPSDSFDKIQKAFEGLNLRK